MSNSTLEKKWIQWYPEKVFLKNKENNEEFLYHSYKFNKEDFFVDVNHKKKVNTFTSNKILETIDVKKTKEYKIGFKAGLSEALKENILLKNKLNSFLVDCEKSFSILQNTLCSRVLNTVLIVASYVIGEKTVFDESRLIQKIKKIIDRDGIFLKKPNLFIHSKNKDLVKKIFKEFLDNYKWNVICDDSLTINSFKIQSENGDIEATEDSRWQQLRRLIDFEE